MSSNLTISYTSQNATGIAPAGAPAADAPPADSPLGFLAALIDQLLAGGADAAATAATSETGTDLSVPGILNLALDTRTETRIAAAPSGTDLLTNLTAQLDALKSQLDFGEAPAPAQLQKLDDAINALAAAIAAPPIAPPVNASPSLDPLQAIAADATTGATPSQPAKGDDPVSQLLASLGLAAPEEPAAAKPALPAKAVAELHDRVLALSQSLAATSPALSQKLEALATQLAAVEDDPALIAQFTAPPVQQDTLTIAKVIRALLGETPAAPAASDDAGKDQPAIANPAPAAHDDLLQILASLGINTPPAADPGAGATTSTDPTVSAVAATPGAAVPPALVRLSTQLTRLSTELADAAPELARKFDAVATRLVSTDADPKLLAQISSAAADPDGAVLEKLVQNLIDAKPVTQPQSAAPQIAATTELPIPAPLAPNKSKSAVTEVKAAPPQPAPVTADSAPPANLKLAVEEAAPERANAEAPAKIEAKVVAEVAKADPLKAEPAPSTQPPVAPPSIAGQQARPLPAAYQPAANPINMGQMAFEMVRQVHQGNSRFTIRLDPPEMGRVDVRMHVDASGTVNARLTVERAETLDMFQRDQRSLERALAQAGLDSSKTNLEFSLRQNPFSGMAGDQRHQQHQFSSGPRFSLNAGDEQAALPAVTLYRGIASAGGVNIFA